jgi:hypothetical protein
MCCASHTIWMSVFLPDSVVPSRAEVLASVEWTPPRMAGFLFGIEPVSGVRRHNAHVILGDDFVILGDDLGALIR